MRPAGCPARPLLLSCLLGLAACSPPGRDGDAAWTAVRDTIGDTIVVRTVAGSLWSDTADLEAEISIGGLDGPPEQTFGRVVSLARAHDGTIYVVDRYAPALRAYGPDGRYLRTLGGPGGGPGEYTEPDGGLGVLSDGTVVLRDPGNGRIQLYAADGAPRAAWRIRGGFNWSDRMLVDAEDRVLTQVLLNPRDDVHDWRTGYVRFFPDGTPVDTLAPPDAGFEETTIEARHARPDGRVSTSIMTVPFGPSEHAVLSPRGYWIHGISNAYAFTLRREASPVRIVRDVEPVPVSPNEKRMARVRTERSLRNTDPTWRWDGTSIPDSKPAWRSLYAGEDGTTWVLVSRPGVRHAVPDPDPRDPEKVREEWTEPLVFDVFEEEGRYLGAVRTPEGFRVDPAPVFTREWVLATVRDALDVQTVTLFRVSSSPSSP